MISIYKIELEGSTFGLIVKSGRIIKTSEKWAMGRRIKGFISYVEKKGGKWAKTDEIEE